jgi:hypothetical protein
MKVRNAPQRRRQQVQVLRRTLETAALLALARRIGLRRGGKLLALGTAAMLDQESAKRRRTRGNEAPMVIGPRGVARLLTQLRTTIRGTKK